MACVYACALGLAYTHLVSSGFAKHHDSRVEHFGFVVAALVFWGVLFRHRHPDHLHYGLAVPFLFATTLQSGILGALMTFSSQAWYPYYAPLVGAWGLTPLQDQQLAGLIMWIPGGIVFALLTI